MASVYQEPWFWVIIIGFIIFLVGAILYEFYRKRSTPWWVILILGLGVLLAIIGAIMYPFSIRKPNLEYPQYGGVPVSIA